MERAARRGYPGVVTGPEHTPFPALTRRQEGVRLAVAALAGLFMMMVTGGAPNGGLAVPVGTDLALCAAALVLVHWRRRWPVPVGVAVMALSGVSTSASGPACLALVSAGTRRRRPEIIAVGVTSVIGGAMYASLTTGGPDRVVTMVFGLVVTVGLIGWGMYLGERRTTVASLRERAERAERERDLQAERARSAERARIAREMHDVLAHRMSLIAMHAGALQYRADLASDEVRDAATLVQTSAHRALDELRQVLGVLRDEGAASGQAVQPPQPTLADVDALVREARAGGIRVDLDVSPAAAGVPDTTGRGAYRIVQEALTNARKHAPGARVRVRIRRDPDALTVDVENPLAVGATSTAPTPGAGLGLVGLAERAALLGGSLEHAESEGTFRVRARLPVAA